MERINLTKYGFIRLPEEDFSDDGNRFTCYKAGKVRVSKLVLSGEVYIAGRIDGSLDYGEYSKLPHYKDMNKLNGISSYKITDDDLFDLYQACLKYSEEYIKAENEIVWPTEEKIAAKRKQIREIRLKEYEEILKLATPEIIFALDNYALTNCRDYFSTLKNRAFPTGTDEEYAKQLYKKPYSRIFVDSDADLKPSYYYEQLKKYLQKN